MRGSDHFAVSSTGFSVTAALSLNGTSSTVVASSTASLRPTTAWSWAGWVRRTIDTTGTKVVARMWTFDGASGGYYSMNWAKGSSYDILFPEALGSVGGTLGRWSDSQLPLNTWVHQVFVYDGGLTGNANRFKGYFGGSQVAATTFFGTIPATVQASGTGHSFRLGHNAGPSLYFGGDYADVRFYKDYALSAAEVASLYNRTANVTTNQSLWYRFLEGSGTSLTDSSGNSNTGTSANASYIAYP